MTILHYVPASGCPRSSSFLSNRPTFPSRSLKPSRSASPNPPNLTNYSGIELQETVSISANKTRLDSWISSRISGISRARVQYSIKHGLVSVNGRVVHKVSQSLKQGDQIKCTISDLEPLKADPENIPLDLIYEDDHVLVVNKPPHMVVHPAPGNPSGTLVNALLHHCRTLPTGECHSDDDEEEDVPVSSIRPGIVHRLDKGTSGVLVVAKNENAHASLSQQFKAHTIERAYISITAGVPVPSSGRIEVPIGRDANNRIRMSASHSNSTSRHAASRYKVREVLVGGGAALVEWKLETGRTHQIRAHAKYIGVPLMGDEVYGGTNGLAWSLFRPRIGPSKYDDVASMLDSLTRPALHALSLGFKHPVTGESVRYTCQPPNDFTDTLNSLRRLM